jgi:dihydrofolate reductase
MTPNPISFAIIVGHDDRRGIGLAGTIPWHHPEDLQFFKRTTMGGTVIMGRKTWDSLPPRFRPLPGRLNIVLSRTLGRASLDDSVRCRVASSLQDALEIAAAEHWDPIFVIGGASLYEQAIQHNRCSELIVSHVAGDYHCDAQFPPYADGWKQVETDQSLAPEVVVRRYRRKEIPRQV